MGEHIKKMNLWFELFMEILYVVWIKIIWSASGDMKNKHLLGFIIKSVSSVTQSCPTLCDLMNYSTPGLPVHHQLSESTQTHVHWWVMPSNHLILCCLLLLLPSIFPSMRIFSNESALHIRWPKYWSFSFSISPSNEHSGLISFRMN